LSQLLLQLAQVRLLYLETLATTNTFVTTTTTAGAFTGTQTVSTKLFATNLESRSLA
jgi:hypothetical protein